MGDSKTMTKETSSSYALEVALRHLRERCEKQAQRIKVLEEENKRLIQNKSDLFSEIGKLQTNPSYLGGSSSHGLGVADDGLGVADDGLDVADDGLGVADDGLGVADDGLDVADDGYFPGASVSTLFFFWVLAFLALVGAATPEDARASKLLWLVLPHRKMRERVKWDDSREKENNIRLRERNITLNHEVHEKHQSLCEAREKLLERQASGGDEERGLDSTTRVSPAPVSRRRGARTTSQESTALGEAKSEDGKRSVVVIGLDGGTEGDSESSEQELDGLEECSMNVNQTLRQILEQKKSLLLVLQALTTAKEELQAKLAVQASSAQKVQSNNNNNNNHPFATTMNGTTTPGVRHQDVTASPSLFEEHRICPICLWQCDPNASTVDGDLDDIFETHVIRHLEEEDSLEETLKTFAPGTAATTS
ncbi:unnamed protein product [Cyprideis torosa]|uniref:Uncharacterized protein n=1 Tax=Cyprideis torosa TaxID=163714 RepID=A0A7R8ZLQ7_9CRUS|nr:unnamed protein product [Cyprideis torosa]CAG0887260.1 unnamed protein product [Cyprideis torosa]